MNGELTQALEFVRVSRMPAAHAANLVAVVAIRETGMLDAFMRKGTKGQGRRHCESKRICARGQDTLPFSHHQNP